MNKLQFGNLVDNRIKNIRDTLEHKSIEYSSDLDRLHNFKIAARILNSTPKIAWRGMFLKHFVSINDMVESKATFSSEMINEKIGDAINYLILLEAILTEEAEQVSEDQDE